MRSFREEERKREEGRKKRERERERERERKTSTSLFFSRPSSLRKKKKPRALEMDRLQRLLGQAGGGGAASGPGGDVPQVDTAEQIYISSLALLKMLKHGEREKA